MVYVAFNRIDWRFNMSHAASKLANEPLWEMDRAHALHPWTNFGPFEEKGSLVIAKGKDCQLWDVDGREYFDSVGGM